MLLQQIFPFRAAPANKQEVFSEEASKKPQLNPSKVFKVKALGLSFNNSISFYGVQNKKRANFEEAPFDLVEIIQAIDTDSYLKQGFAKYKELFWKEGWDIISEDPDAVRYLWKRIDLFEEIMKRPFNDFLMEAVDQLVKLGNVFIVEVRADIRKYFPEKLYPESEKETIAGYYIIPTETVRILRDKNSILKAVKQVVTDESSIYNNVSDVQEPMWSAEEIIHLYWDRKPGRIFGTPFIVSVLDDVKALRQIEEDVQNLIHKEIWPFYKYTIGTETKPSSPEELEEAANQIEGMRVDGGLILPERHNVEIIGAESKAMDVSKYLEKFTNRVITGLGLSPHHLGLMSEGGNRSVTDRLDAGLYDKIKVIQAYVEDMIRTTIFNRLLKEGGFDPSESPSGEGTSSRCYMKFREIDIDTQIKKETHLLNKFQNNAISLAELRVELGRSPEVELEALLMSLSAEVTALQQIAVQANAPTPATTVTTASGGKKVIPGKIPMPIKPDAIKPSTGGVPNTPNTKKGTGNIMKPSNQHGRSMSPNIRHDDQYIDEIVELLGEDYDNESDF